MKKFLKILGILFLGFVFATASGNINRGRPDNPVYQEIRCDANHRGCVGDYLYGWPFGSHMGYGGDYDTLWAQYLLNIVFWTLMVWAFSWSIRTVYRALRRQ